jgi:predicted ATPase/class 3 adenylate cyclase
MLGTTATGAPMATAGYPSGTVAFLFTDIEGSTKRWERDAGAMRTAVEHHFDLLRAAIESEGGVVFKTIGDAVQAAFPSVPAAVRAAIAAQDALHAADFGPVGEIRVRMAIHVGEARPIDGDYAAPVLNRLARVLSTGYGEQVLLTEAAQSLASDNLPAGHTLRDLGAHRLQDLLVAERIFQLAGPGLREQFPPLKSLDNRPHNLPAQPTELIGREAELEHVRRLLTTPGTRLVTLTGPGGTGKTRIAVQAGAELLDAFPDGVWWVPLAELTDPELVPEAIAAALGVREQAGQPLMAALTDYLGPRRTLLVLDNLEQILGTATHLAALLEAAPGLAILATSREPLRLRAEREVPVAPLTLPPEGILVTPEMALASPAVQLFVARAQAVKPDFALTADNAAPVVAICRSLDGLPLAIELAAARVRLLAPAALLARLEARLPLLTGGARDLPARQQTLRAAIAWSHDLLDPAEQTLFSRLSVFAGGCTLTAALAVTEAVTPLPIDLLDGLESLVQKSLLRQTDVVDDEPRFSMLETIREFGLEQLAANPDDETSTRAAHAAYFREVVGEAIDTEDQVASYRQLETELGNLRAVLDWQERHGDAMDALEFATNLRWFWWVRGHLREGQTRLDATLKKCPSAPPELRANALSGLGVLLEATGDFARAKLYHEQALALYREIDDAPGIAEALENLGIIAATEGDLDRSQSLREDVLALRRASGDKRGIAVALINLGNVAYLRGDFAGAISFYEEARTLSLETGDQWILSTALGNVGGAMIRQFSSSHDDQRQAGGDPTSLDPRAVALIQEALRIARELGDQERILDHVLMLAEAAASTNPRSSAMLLGAADAIAQAAGYQLSPVDPGHHAEVVAAVRDRLGATFDDARRSGAGLGFEGTIEAALNPSLLEPEPARAAPK